MGRKGRRRRRKGRRWRNGFLKKWEKEEDEEMGFEKNEKWEKVKGILVIY